MNNLLSEINSSLLPSSSSSFNQRQDKYQLEIINSFTDKFNKLWHSSTTTATTNITTTKQEALSHHQNTILKEILVNFIDSTTQNHSTTSQCDHHYSQQQQQKKEEERGKEENELIDTIGWSIIKIILLDPLPFITIHKQTSSSSQSSSCYCSASNDDTYASPVLMMITQILNLISAQGSPAEHVLYILEILTELIMKLDNIRHVDNSQDDYQQQELFLSQSGLAEEEYISPDDDEIRQRILLLLPCFNRNLIKMKSKQLKSYLPDIFQLTCRILNYIEIPQFDTTAYSRGDLHPNIKSQTSMSKNQESQDNFSLEKQILLLLIRLWIEVYSTLNDIYCLKTDSLAQNSRIQNTSNSLIQQFTRIVFSTSSRVAENKQDSSVYDSLYSLLNLFKPNLSNLLQYDFFESNHTPFIEDAHWMFMAQLVSDITMNQVTFTNIRNYTLSPNWTLNSVLRILKHYESQIKNKFHEEKMVLALEWSLKDIFCFDQDVFKCLDFTHQEIVKIIFERMAFAYTSSNRNKLYFILLNFFNKLPAYLRVQTLHQYFMSSLIQTVSSYGDSKLASSLFELKLKCGLSLWKDWIHSNRDHDAMNDPLNIISSCYPLLDFHHNMYYVIYTLPQGEQVETKRKTADIHNNNDHMQLCQKKRPDYISNFTLTHIYTSDKETFLKKEGFLIQLTNFLIYIIKRKQISKIGSQCTTASVIELDTDDVESFETKILEWGNHLKNHEHIRYCPILVMCLDKLLDIPKI